jgi:peroxiredoxin
LQSHYRTFQDAGAEVVSLVVATVEVAAGWCQRAGVSYPMLADPDHRVAEAYGVYNLLGDGLAAPAVFVVDTDMRIIWSHVGWHAGDWVDAPTVLAQLP